MMNSVKNGLIAEKQFIIDSIRNNLYVSIPSHDNSGYDVIVQGEKHLRKVQIKSTSVKDCDKRRDCYRVHIRRGVLRRLYNSNEVDFFAVYLSDIDLWYIIPFAMCSSSCIRLYPEKKSHKLNQFIRAWHLF